MALMLFRRYRIIPIRAVGKSYIYGLMSDLGLYEGWLFCGVASEFYCGFVAQLRWVSVNPHVL